MATPWAVQVLTLDFNLAVRDAEFECARTGAKLEALKAPIAMVCTHRIQGIATRS